MMRMWQGAVGIAPADGLVSPAYVVARPFSETDAAYYAYLFRTAAYMREIDVFSRGIVPDRNRLYWESFKQMPSVYPTLDEQRLIVRFLDWHGAQVSKLIRAKKKLIALLNEQKHAIVHRGVTQGLNSSVAIKPSRVSWTSHIPQHWELRRLKYCITPLEQGWSPQCESQPAGEHEWGVLKVGCVNKESFAGEQNKKLPIALEIDTNLEIKHGDILVSRANTRELLGLATLVEHPRRKLILCDKLFRFQARPAIINQKFLVLTLRSQPSRAQIESSTNGASSSMQNIGQDVLKNLWIGLPSVAEQEAIVEQVNQEAAPLNQAIARFEREIELMREFRIRLINDVVTGKLDVRTAAANLPESTEPEPIDEQAEDEDLDETTLEEAETEEAVA
jgi:type I restriction enzyme S subunit